MSALYECFSLRKVVIDFTVEDQPQRFIFIRHGLSAGNREVNDGEAPESKSDIGIDPIAGIVRSAMSDGVCRAGYIFDVWRWIPVNCSDDSTHFSSMPIVFSAPINGDRAAARGTTVSAQSTPSSSQPARWWPRWRPRSERE